MQHNKKGFTLIELLVVIAIIGILSSIVVVSLNSARAKGRDAKRITDIKQLSLALTLYYDACGRQYPAPISGALTKTGPGNSTGPGCPSGTDIDDFINPIPVNPTGGGAQNAYDYYTIPASGAKTDFIIRATLEANNTTVLNSALVGNPPTGFPNGTNCNHTAAPYYYCIGS